MSEDLMGLEIVRPLNRFSHIPISFLGEEFYKGTRNELTKKKLTELALLANKIREPNPYGKYFNEEHYLQTLDLVLGSTAETRHRGIFFLRNVLPSLLSRNALLDVGPGCGTLTRWIGKNFKQITVVDNNQKVIEDLNVKKKVVRKKTELIKIQNSILEAKLFSNYYDLGVISHVLYYIDKREWLDAVQHVYNSIKPGGIVVIALSGDQNGKAKLMKHFGGALLDINFLAKICLQRFGELYVKVYASNEAFYAIDIIAMLHIAGFFLCDAHVTATKGELLTYIINHCLTENGHFELSTQQKFILIHKKI